MTVAGLTAPAWMHPDKPARQWIAIESKTQRRAARRPIPRSAASLMIGGRDCRESFISSVAMPSRRGAPPLRCAGGGPHLQRTNHSFPAEQPERKRFVLGSVAFDDVLARFGKPASSARRPSPGLRSAAGTTTMPVPDDPAATVLRTASFAARAWLTPRRDDAP